MAIFEHEIHIKLEDEAILWRYMSFSKFESLLKEKALFFCRADKFSDPFECSIPKKEAEHRSSEANFRLQEAIFGRFDSNYDEAVAQKQSEDLAQLHRRVKIATTVNCWHINNQESDAMWQLYLKDNEGVAIKTDKARLISALNEAPQQIGVSKVRYIDYINGIWYDSKEFPFRYYNLITPLIHKRLEFKHECELRLYHQNPEREKPGYWEKQVDSIGEFIKVDVNNLIESVIFHPTADEITKEKIIRLAKKYGFEFIFQQSKMTISPSF